MGFKEFLVKTFVPFAGSLIKAKKIAEEDSVIKGTIKYYKEYFCEDVPGTSHIYKLGKYDGKKEGFKNASDVYEQKLTDQADEFIRQKELLKQETEKYEELIDDMEREIEALENKLNRSEEENRALNLLIQKLNELKQAYS
ncbi:hypothetical protein [Succinivibrio dextrinosolvens]|uniref:hypothetical protein n=1 Tax=Succinivibrio dextrinosolvens TaxID=83771 RepID=UPI00241F33E6|nr:hypothetical protein [Succinivibrio dextrinosolvens]MBE6422520.1 hypothetical protein [Succinivibrio dextrinosolvens]